MSEMSDRAAVRDAMQILAELRRAYARYMRTPTAKNWAACEHAHRNAVDALRVPAVAELIDQRLSRNADAGHGAPREALERMQLAANEIVEFERRLGRDLGFRDDELSVFVRDARRVLRRVADRSGAGLPSSAGSGSAVFAIETCAELVSELEHIAATLQAIFDDTRNDLPFGIKGDERGVVRRWVLRRLYLVGSVVANAAHPSVFSYSFAVSLGLSGVPTRGGRRVRRSVLEQLNRERPSP